MCASGLMSDEILAEIVARFVKQNYPHSSYKLFLKL